MTTSILEEGTEEDRVGSPRAESRVAVVLSQQQIEHGLKALHLALQGKRLPFVVLIEDDDTDADLFRLALKAGNIPVEFMHFRDGKEALKYFRGKGRYADRQAYPLPQLTVLDFKLLQCSGLEILREIRTKLPSEFLVVVALTGSIDCREKEQASSLHINDWVNKPLETSDLNETVGCILRTWLA